MGGIRAKIAHGLVAVSALIFVSAGAALAEDGVDLLPPALRTSFRADPAPIPVPSEGRIPVSLRIANSIWTDDGSHPPAASEVRFELDRSFRLDLSGVPRCPDGIHYDIRTEVSRCEKVKFAIGRMKFEVAFPEVEPLLVTGRAIAYKFNSRTLMVRGWFPAPITGGVLIPVDLAKTPSGTVYGLRATASIPTVAGGSGSLVYLGLRFRKGLYSAACPHGRLQSRVTNTFVDGTIVSAAAITTC